MGPKRWPVILRHGPVALRPLRRGDEKAWHEVRRRNDSWTGPWDATRPPESDEVGRSFGRMVGDFNRQAREGRMLPWVITYEPPGALGSLFAGQLTVSGIAYGSARWGMVGYWVDQRWAGRGIAPTALALAADYVLLGLRLHRLEVAIRPENVKSLRVVQKLGLRYEGERPAYLHVDGAWRDHSMFAIHSDELGPGGLIGRLDAQRAREASADGVDERH